MHMKITNISAYHNRHGEDTETTVDLNISLPGHGSLFDAIEIVRRALNLDGRVADLSPNKALNGSSESYNANTAKLQDTVDAAKADTKAEPVAGGRRRGRAATVEVSHTPNTVVEVVETAPAEGGRRRRQTTAPATDAGAEVQTAPNDIEMAKACSNAAVVTGIELVQDVLAEFGVKSANEIPAERRMEFIGELNKEIDLVNSKAATAGASA